MAENTTEKSRDQQINDLATRVATEFKSVKASIPNTNTLIPKTENRGELAGWQNEGILGAVSYTGETASFITAGSPDAMSYNGGGVTTFKVCPTCKDNNGYMGDSIIGNISWVKTLRIVNLPACSISFGTEFTWITGEAPTIEVGDIIVIFWSGTHGFLNILKANPS